MIKNKQGNIKRQFQFSEEIRRNLSLIINEDINFDEFAITSITIIKIISSKDLRHCKVYFRSLSNNNKGIEEFLNNKSSFLSHLLSKKMYLRSVPKLIFYEDDTIKIIEELGL